MRGTLRCIACVVVRLTIAFAAGERSQGRQSTLNPLVELNVAFVQ
jgi:hypothetical protein